MNIGLSAQVREGLFFLNASYRARNGFSKKRGGAKNSIFGKLRVDRDLEKNFKMSILQQETEKKKTEKKNMKKRCFWAPSSQHAWESAKNDVFFAKK